MGLRFWKVLKGSERLWEVLKGSERFWEVMSFHNWDIQFKIDGQKRKTADRHMWGSWRWNILWIFVWSNTNRSSNDPLKISEWTVCYFHLYSRVNTASLVQMGQVCESAIRRPSPGSSGSALCLSLCWAVNVCVLMWNQHTWQDKYLLAVSAPLIFIGGGSQFKTLPWFPVWHQRHSARTSCPNRPTCDKYMQPLLREATSDWGAEEQLVSHQHWSIVLTNQW